MISQLVSANMVFLYHVILTEGQNHKLISEEFVNKMTASFKDEVFLRFLNTPETCLLNIDFLDTFCRDLLYSGNLEEQNLLGFVLGTQNAGKTSFSLSIKKRHATTSETVIDPITGETLEKQRF